MSKPTIIYVGASEGFEALAETALGAECRHVEAEPGALAEALAGAHGLLDASMKVRIDDAMIAAAPNLAVISCATTGTGSRVGSGSSPEHAASEARQNRANARGIVIAIRKP